MSPCNVTFFGQINATTDDLCNYANYHAIAFVLSGVLAVVMLVIATTLFMCKKDGAGKYCYTACICIVTAFGFEAWFALGYLVVIANMVAASLPRRNRVHVIFEFQVTDESIVSPV